MSHTVLRVRRLPNYKFYQLKLVRTENPVIVVAVLTQYAINLGVRFDNDLKDYRFNLSEFLGNDNGNWCTGTRFEATAKNIGLDLSDREHRCLVADLEYEYDGKQMDSLCMRYSLDNALELVDYFHPVKKTVYFRLGVKVRTESKRTLVLCFDGPSDYLSGQGRSDDGAVWYFHRHLINGYKFLVETYQDGDGIYIFGVSRGAYTARALAGMIHCVGLLPRQHVEYIPFAYETYASEGRKGPSWWKTIESYPGQVFESIFPPSDNKKITIIQQVVPDSEVPDNIAPSNAPLVGDPPDVAPPNNPLKPDHTSLEARDSNPRNMGPEVYKQAYCLPVRINFVGVWDTVAPGLPQTLPYIDYNPSILAFRHALALDEHRASLVPSLWDHTKTNHTYQSVREVWFRGQHDDVGGGTPLPTPTLDYESSHYSALSNIPLRWMVQQCFEDNHSIVFDPNTMELCRRQHILEHRPAQPALGDYKNLNPDLSRWRNIVDQVNRGSMFMPNDLRDRLLYEESAKLDKRDIVHQVHEPSGALLPYWLNRHKSRMIRCDLNSVYLHVSVVDFPLTRNGAGYKPKATWLGLNYGQSPIVYVYSYEGRIEAGLRSDEDAEAVAEALDMRWNSMSLWTWIRAWGPLLSVRIEAFFDLWSSG
ncbi:unnamed protein product [Rhizoctonia solani]|uniref:T6SS Phospholipase effector Tle1-like catalytic domain-containing protein n=1 Tax=Rhizoctonia solani TaxID=456999 RepID=A0A8H2WD65_9AGAM|nr:unnamed protein product [Rhizoctonia solani]